MKKTIPVVFILAIAMIGFAAADVGMPETAETQGFTTATSVTALGTTTENDAMVWQETNCGFCGLEYITPINPMHAYYLSSYREDTLADQGLTSYVKSMEVDTAKKEANQFNVEAQKVVSFVADDTGRMTSEEDILLDGAAGFFVFADNLLICPFAGGQYTYVPAFCNVVEMGSEVDLYEGTLDTDVEERHIMAANTQWDPREGEAFPMPISDPGVETSYNIVLTGVAPDSAAVGSASASIDVRIMEGRMFAILNPFEETFELYPKAEDLTYSERTTASGAIPLFRKSMSYDSKITAPGILPLFPD